MSAPYVGFSVQRESLEPASASNAKMSVIGLAGPFSKATSADQAAFDAAFPVNTPVLINTTDAKARMIDPDGEIGRALSLINAQMADGQTAALAVLVRVAAGVSDDATIANIAGNSAAGTGIHAFKRAGSICGVFPRLIAVPGFTKQTKTGLTGLTVTAQGSGYTSAPTVAFSGGGGTGAAATATIVDGKVTGLTITNAGSGYTSAPSVAFSGGAGTGATATASVGMLANPVAASLPSVLDAIFAIGYVFAGSVDATASKSYRETLSSKRLNVIDTGVKVIDSAGSTIDTDPCPALLGLHVRRDFAYDGRPFRSILNQPVYGIVGPSRDVEFNLLDGSSEGQDLLSNQIGVIVRGEGGNDFAIADGGFVFMGFENVGDESVWQQTHKVRGRDFIELTVIRTVRQYLGKFNLTTQTIQTIVDTVDDILAIAEARQEILGRRVRFDPDLNNTSDLRTGMIYVEAKFEEAPVFRKMNLVSRPYVTALSSTIETILASQA